MSRLVHKEELKRFITEVFKRADMPEADAAWTADTLTQAELRGTSSHGVIRTSAYVTRLKSKTNNPTPNIKVIKDAGALALMDGDNGMGQVVSKRGMEESLDRAEKHNVGVVIMQRSNHFGAAGTFAQLALKRGMVGIVTTNAVKTIAPAGGKEKILGNNPVAIAIPGDPPIELDMALSTVARGYVLQAHMAGKNIPEGWGVDAEGEPTTDPNEVLESGSLTAIAGYKGVGLSVAIDAILGALTGGAHSHGIGGLMDPTDPGNVTHFFAAIRIESLIPMAEFRATVNTLCSVLRAAPKAAGVERIYMPGEKEYDSEQALRASGIPLLPERYTELAELARQLDIPEMETFE
ncbi:MAG: Ldh family oxidoreductase [Nitrospinaceae bacterium]|jgi:LDH2 family malate/lactate/ureidoglycolate dehydrogenase|nr:Ldh family oxidoreductase [Nitrospinaceae bacterium]MBT3433741.1 Ldh family oxidoreductase [Nitrospinaceae bacterium]MBT3822605.1 Ldh family oxidoreductase [Nitrospinaceae bacterium]MBT4095833.1 Ldh family oxidoreductase [Nitrospinaceae bacterium]MBT4432184.1 Ldh family oxidoreductase [Nitrospinaceae bacterium]